MKLTSLLTLVLVVGSVANGNAQSAGSEGACKAGQTAPLTGSRTWPADSLVEAYVRLPDFAADEVLKVLTAVSNWDASAGMTGQGYAPSTKAL